MATKEALSVRGEQQAAPAIPTIVGIRAPLGGRASEPLVLLSGPSRAEGCHSTNGESNSRPGRYNVSPALAGYGGGAGEGQRELVQQLLHGFHDGGEAQKGLPEKESAGTGTVSVSVSAEEAAAAAAAKAAPAEDHEEEEAAAAAAAAEDHHHNHNHLHYRHQHHHQDKAMHPHSIVDDHYPTPIIKAPGQQPPFILPHPEFAFIKPPPHGLPAAAGAAAPCTLITDTFIHGGAEIEKSAISNMIINGADHTITSNSDKLKVFHLEPSDMPCHHGTSTFFQATLNCVSLLFGLGILSSPYAVAEAGWAGVVISLLISSTYAYTAHLMAKCVDYHPECGTYQDMAKFALGKRMRKLITALFYIEITGTLVGYSISIGDNLNHIFPNTKFGLPGLNNRNFMIFVASLIMLPSVWLRDLSALSFTSIWCIISSVLLLISILLCATINHVGFHHPLPLLRIKGVPVAAGLYAFSYGGTSVFPSIYKSMKDPSKFTQALLVSFSIVTASMVGLGIAGAYMFGHNTKSQVTLSMPIHFISTKIVVWMTILTPMFKFALQLSPITTAVEARLYRRCKASKTMLFGMGTLMRSTVLALIAILSMVLPYFEYVIALVGSSMTIAICMIFPCVFYLKLYWKELKSLTKFMIIFLVFMGIMVGAYGSIIAFNGLIKRKSDSL